MKITVWGINYAPELTGIGPYNTMLCEFLRDAGHEVHMVSTFTYYPAWQKNPGDRGVWYRTEDMEGVTVHRCWHYVPRRVRTLTRILHEGSFVMTSFLRQLCLRRADVLVVVSPPLLLGAAAWVLGKLKRMPYVFHVQDLQPDAAAGLGLLKNGPFLRVLRGLERLAYRQAAQVSGITPGMLQAFGDKGVEAARHCYFPNPVVLPDLDRLPRPGRFRQRLGLNGDNFLVVYSGNLGVKQGLDGLVEAARLLQDERVHLVICGEGNRRRHLLQRVNAYALNNVTMLQLQPEDRYRELLTDADLCVIPQQPGTGTCFFPSKLLNTLALAKPVLTVADEASELVAALRDGRFGVNVEPGQPAKLAATLDQLANQSQAMRELGLAGRRYVEQFERERVLGRFAAVLRQVVEPEPIVVEPVPVPASSKVVALPAEVEPRKAA